MLLSDDHNIDILLGAYLFSQIPLPDLSRSDDNFDLGFGLQRDLSNYEDEYFPESYEVQIN